MLSILIPTYNYNVYPLVREIHKQTTKQGIDFEILIYDDCSTKHFETEKLIVELDNVILKRMSSNQGRTKLRHLLAEDSKYNFLLFLDADMFPENRFFIAKYLKEIKKINADLFFGGISVPNTPPSKKQILRWKYGKEREYIPVEKRKLFPYRSIISGALLINKKVYLKTSEKLKNLNRYGLDIYFSYLLKQNNVSIHHFNNPITHLGLEEADNFTKKTERAVKTLNFLVSNNYIPHNYSRLSKKTYGINKLGLTKVFKLFFFLSNKLCKNNLLSSSPSLFIFDIYKLCYFCTIIN